MSHYQCPIPGSADPGSMTGEAHNLPVDPTITTALLLDPTGPGYRLDSKLVAELSAPLPKKVASLPFLPFLFVLLPFLLGTLVLYFGVEDRMLPLSGPPVPTSTQDAKIYSTTSAPRGVPVDVDKFLQLNHVQATPQVSGSKFDTKPINQR